ncbi:hypothetical protein M758_12G168900, partial [Ceratodon purpureus]
MASEPRLPLQDSRRRDARDLKLNIREEIVADRQGATKRVCPCNICMGENFSIRFRAVVREHLKLYGRHPWRRGSTEGFPKDESDGE